MNERKLRFTCAIIVRALILSEFSTRLMTLGYIREIKSKCNFPLFHSSVFFVRGGINSFRKVVLGTASSSGSLFLSGVRISSRRLKQRDENCTVNINPCPPWTRERSCGGSFVGLERKGPGKDERVREIVKPPQPLSYLAPGYPVIPQLQYRVNNPDEDIADEYPHRRSDFRSALKFFLNKFHLISNH